MVAGEPPPPLPQRCATTIRTACRQAFRGFKAVFAPSIHSYFMWSSFLYLGCGAAIMIMSVQIKEFLCKVRPEHDAATGTGWGCSKCPSTLLLCGKDTCLQSAVNVTYRLEAKLSTHNLYQPLQSAATSQVCNEYAKSATSVEAMLGYISAHSPQSEVEECKKFWCGVLENVLDNTDLSSPDGASNCTNTHLFKKSSESSTCICQGTRTAVVSASGSHTALATYCRLSVGAEIRRLQAAATPATVDNDELQDYQVAAWSQCSCYMQCMPGVRTRLVQCLAAKCRDPMPAVKEECTCAHCAQCEVETNLFVLTITFFVQGGVAFLVFLSFLYYESKSEDSDSLVKIPYLMMPIGFFCKQLPPLVRIFMLVNTFQLAFVVITAFVPVTVLDIMPDCNESEQLRVLALVASIILILQFCLGRLAKMYTRKPPYLYAPQRPGGLPGISHLRALLRSLGP
eukprot:TRINITY_DN12262_c0_g1_i1.p1 TRINITY_DN12262_c0_g1~~TRINITY_DN12262_c0_g1_i1.p1  ORF type:complete len:455 (-),score=59.89 TRINITY_DN12262_c0_g1_i1:512-1876(-)